jgi:hypothetical protein
MSKKTPLDLSTLKMATLVAMVNHLAGSEVATMKTFSQRSKAVDRVLKLAEAGGIHLEEVFDAEGAVIPPKPVELPKPAAPAAKDKPAEKEKKVKGPSIRSVAEELLMEVVGVDENKRKVGHSYETILAKLQEQFQGAKTTVACLRWYAVHMRDRNVMPPNRPRAVPAKAAAAPAETSPETQPEA